MLVGRFRPVARISFWNELAFATFTGTASRERRVARRIARTRGQRVRTVRDRTGVPRQRVRRSGILDSGVDTVDEKLHSGDTDVVTRVCGHIHDVRHLGVARGRGDRNRRRCRVAGAAGDGGVHVRLDLGGCQCPVVDAGVVDATVEVEVAETRAAADVDVGRRVLLGRGDRAEQRAVVELAVQIHVQLGRRRVVDPRDVVPGVRLQRGRPIPEHVAARAVRELEPDRARPPIDRRVKLITDLATRTLGDDRRIIDRERRRVDPRTHGHAPRQLQQRRIPQLDKVVHTIQQHRTRVPARPPPRPVRQRPRQPTPRRIRSRRPRPLIERIAGNEPRGALCRGRGGYEGHQSEQECGACESEPARPPRPVSGASSRLGQSLCYCAQRSPPLSARPKHPQELRLGSVERSAIASMPRGGRILVLREEFIRRRVDLDLWLGPARLRSRPTCSECDRGRLPLPEALRDELGPLLRAPALQHLEV